MHQSNGGNMCVYYGKSDITVIYPISLSSNLINYHEKLVINKNTERKIEQKKLYVTNGKVDDIAIYRTSSKSEYKIDGKEVDYNEYKDFKDNFIYKEMKGHGYTMYSEDTPDHMIEKDYKAYLTISHMQLEKEHSLEKIVTPVETLVSINENLTFHTFEDIPYDKYITVHLPDGSSKIDCARGLYIVDTKQIYYDLFVAYCTKFGLKYEIPSHGQLGEFDKIEGNYTSKIMTGLTTYKQFLSYEEALNGKQKFKDHITSRLGIYHNKKLDSLSAVEVISKLQSLAKCISHSDVKVSGQNSYRQLHNQINNLIKLVEERSDTHLKLEIE